jgi:CHAT domain-containing protein/tetratricopeptide (TPR) repeat protein
VLVIDDGPTIRMLIVEALAGSGYAVIEAPDGTAGMRVLESNARIRVVNHPAHDIRELTVLCQPNGLRTEMACQPNQLGSIIAASRETLDEGKVISRPFLLGAIMLRVVVTILLLLGVVIAPAEASSVSDASTLATQEPVNLLSIPPKIRAPTDAEQAEIRDLMGKLSEYHSLAAQAKALEQFDELIPIFERTYGEGHPATLLLGLGRAESLDGTRAHKKAETVLAIVVRGFRSGLGASSPHYQRAVISAATNQIYQGQLASADVFLAMLDETQLTSSLDKAIWLSNMGFLRNLQGRFTEAEALYHQSSDIREPLLKPDDMLLASNKAGIARSILGQGRYAEAEKILVDAIVAHPAEDFGAARLQEVLGDIALKRGNLLDAVHAFQKAYGLYKRFAGDLSPELSELAAKSLLADASIDHVAFSASFEASPMAVAEIQCARVGIVDLATLREVQTLIAAEGRPTDAVPCAEKLITFLDVHFGQDNPETIVARRDLGELYKRIGRMDEAEALLRRVVDTTIKVQGAKHPETIRGLIALSDSLFAGGKYADAAMTIENAARASSDAPIELRQLVMIARASQLDGLGLPAKAAPIWISVFGQMTSEYQNLPIFLKTLTGYLFNQLVLGKCHPELHETIRKFIESKRSIDLSKGALADEPIEEAWAQSLACSGQWAEAAERYGAVAFNKLPQGNFSYERGLTQARRALTFALNPAMIASGDEAGADEAARDAVNIARTRRYIDSHNTKVAPTKLLRLTAPEGGRDPLAIAFLAMLRLSWTVDQLPEPTGKYSSLLKLNRAGAIYSAFEAAQDLGISSAGQALVESAARMTISDPALVTLARRRQALSDEIRVDDHAIEVLSEGTSNQKSTEVNGLRAELGTVNGEILKKYPRYAELTSPHASTIYEVKERLAPGDALLMITSAWNDVYVFAVSSTGITWKKAAITTDAFDNKVRGLRCLLDGISCRMGEDPNRPFDLAIAKELYDILIAPVESALTGSRQLFVVANGSLGGLPLGLLVTDYSKDDPLGSASWLSDRYALVSLPSVSSLGAFGKAKVIAAKSEFVGYGDPVLGPPESLPSARGGSGGMSGDRLSASRGAGELADVAEIRLLHSLPHTRTELQTISTVLGAQSSALHLGNNATETAVKADAQLKNARVIVFATHGLLPTELRGLEEPGLVLTPPLSPTTQDDGLLTASEIAALDLSAEWIILSACNTASGSTPGGESLSGLARSFLYAGARSILASHWQVNDAATAALTTQALKIALADPSLTRAQAVQRAMRVVRTGKMPDGAKLPGWTPEWRDPWFWAPFVLVETGN